MTLPPFSILNASIRVSDDAISFLLSIFPFAFIDSTVGILINAESFLLALHVVPFILFSIGPNGHPVAVKFALLEFSIVFVFWIT